MVVELKIKRKNPWAGIIKYKSCFDYIAPYFTRSGSIYTGLTPEDEKYFEQALGYPEGTLSKSSDFWKTFSVKVGSRALILDDQYPRQAMIIKFLSGHKRVSTSLRKCLRIWGVKADNLSNELVESTLFNLVDKHPGDFFKKWINNKQKDTDFLLEEAIAKGIIRKDRTQYYYGSELFADSKQDAIAYLDAKKNQDLKLSIINQIESK